RSYAHTPRSAAAVAHEIETELAVAPFRERIDFARGELQTLHHDLEVLDGALDRRIDVAFRRQNHARIVDVDRPRIGHAHQRLLDDARALLDFLDPHHEPIEAVARLSDRHFEVDLAVLHVRVGFADVVGNAARAQTRTRPAERNRVVGAHEA